MTMPSFFLIGAAKSASSSLHDYLGQHPDIFMSLVKEPNFFAFEGGAPPFLGPDDEAGPWCGERAGRARLMRAKYKASVTRASDYRRLFAKASGARAIGESSVVYLYCPVVAARIREAVPDARVMVILRQPVDRAYSKFTQMRKDGCEPLADFVEALRAEPDRIRRGWSPAWHYLARGRYHAQLLPWFEQFSRDRLHVMLYDDLEADPIAVLRSAYRFLGVDEAFQPDISVRLLEYEGVVDVPRTRFGDWLLNYTNPFKSAFNRMVPGRGLRKPVRRMLLALNRRGRRRWTREPLPLELRRELTETFRADIERLEALTGRDLGSWLR